MTKVEVKGTSEVTTKLVKSNMHVGRRIAAALRAGGTFLLRESKAVVPEETGKLKKSGYTKNVGKKLGLGANIVVGYTADHAALVHEILDNKHGREFNTANSDKIAWVQANGTSSQKRIWKARKPEEQAKFLEEPARKFRRKIFKIIATKAKI